MVTICGDVESMISYWPLPTAVAIWFSGFQVPDGRRVWTPLAILPALRPGLVGRSSPIVISQAISPPEKVSSQSFAPWLAAQAGGPVSSDTAPLLDELPSP